MLRLLHILRDQVGSKSAWALVVTSHCTKTSMLNCTSIQAGILRVDIVAQVCYSVIVSKATIKPLTVGGEASGEAEEKKKTPPQQ